MRIKKFIIKIIEIRYYYCRLFFFFKNEFHKYFDNIEKDCYITISFYSNIFITLKFYFVIIKKKNFII